MDIFNPNGSDDIIDRKIIGGSPTGISDFNRVKYHWTTELYREMLATYWLPEIIPVSRDRPKYRALSKRKREAVNDTLSFLIFLDSQQTLAIPEVSHLITAPEVKKIFPLQAFQEVVHCYDSETEVLTSKGFKPISLITKDDLIANYWLNSSNNPYSKGNITFENPTEIIISDYSGKMVSYEDDRIDFLVTPNHRVIYREGDVTGKEKVIEAKEFKKNVNHSFITGGTYKNEKGKVFPWEDLHKINLSDFNLEELSLENGSHRFSDIRMIQRLDGDDLNKVQAFLAVSGCSTKVVAFEDGYYDIEVEDIYQTTSVVSVSPKEVDYNGTIHCLTVPSGALIVRRNEKVFVSGNSQSYAYILESLCEPVEREQILYRFKDDPDLLKRCLQITNIYQKYIDNKDDVGLLKVILLAFLHLEGTLFYNGFYFFYNLANAGDLLDVAAEIRLINRDEENHLKFISNVIKTAVEEGSISYTKEEVLEVVKPIIDFEIYYATKTYGEGIPGITPSTIRNFTNYRANYSLKMAGLPALFEDTGNPYHYLDGFAVDTGNIKTAMFETKPTGYKQSAITLTGWEEI